MSAGAAGEGFQRGFCISGRDMSIERRPYHKNCKCALHKDNKAKHCSHASPTNSVSFPIRRTWSESCLNASSPTTFAAAAAAAQGNFTRTRTHLDLVLYQDVDDIDDHEVD